MTAASSVLAGRIILVTGAAGTLGSAIAVAAREAGATVIATDITAADGVDFAHDVVEPDDWMRVCDAVEQRHGRLDGLVNNAGILHLGTIEDTSLEAWRRVMAVNADGVFLGCKLAWPLLVRSPGAAIVNVSSVSGIVAGANLAAYNASKGAVRLLTKSVALHGARVSPPVRCNSVHPAFVEGAMAEQAVARSRTPDLAREKLAADIPMRRLAVPREVADAVIFLLSDGAGFMTGSEIVIDGGLSAK